MNGDQREPRWVEARRLSLLHPDGMVRRDLTDPQSLTRKMVRGCPGRFSVERIQQRFSRHRQGERTVLQMKLGVWGNVRTVWLRCDGEARVYARTVIPVQAVRRRLLRLTRLGNRSLGAVLHGTRSSRRERVEFARLDARHTLYHEATAGIVKPPSQLWGRRTLYRFHRAPVLVHELFLTRLPWTFRSR